MAIFASYTMIGGFIQIFLIIALVMLGIKLINGRRFLLAVSAKKKERRFCGQQIDNASWDRSHPSRDRGFYLSRGQQSKQIIAIGSIQASADTQKTILIPPLLGGLMLVGGIVLVVAGSKKSS